MHSMKHFGINTDLMPLAKFSKSTLDEAIKLLGEISDRIKVVEEEQRKPPNQTNFNKVQECFDEMSELSNTFYELIPHTNFSHTMMQPLTDNVSVMAKIQMITDLTDVCLARKLIIGATFKIKQVNPLDYCYASLQIKLELLETTGGEYKAIEQYARNTSQGHGMRIKHVYRLQRKGEAERHQQWKNLANHFLLWHGSGTSNYIGIMSEGLRIAPPSAPVSGYAFGKGIYFADMFAKSYPYCRSTPGEHSFMLLSEVALGKMHEVKVPTYTEQVPDGYDSVLGLGRRGPDFSQSIVLPNGVRIPISGAVEHVRKADEPYRHLEYNEYIVYNPTQVRMRYLVELA